MPFPCVHNPDDERVGAGMKFDRFTIVGTYYLWLKDHHTGQGSKEYARLCKIASYYCPSRSCEEVHWCEDEEIVEGYKTLCARNGCRHKD